MFDTFDVWVQLSENHPKKEEKNEAMKSTWIRDTQREHSSKPIKHNIVKRILVFTR